jgi:hypothetical protein
MAEAIVVQRWYPVGGLYVNGQRVLTRRPQHQGPVLTPGQQTPDDVRAEFSSLLRENAERRQRIAATPTQQEETP